MAAYLRWHSRRGGRVAPVRCGAIACLSLVLLASVSSRVWAADGTPDTAFSANLGTGFNGSVLATAVQRDGKIVIGGSFTTLNGVPAARLARLNADGSPDTAFITNLGTGFDGDASAFVSSLAVQGDGKIVVGGHFGALNGVFTSRLARLNADGSPDTAFNANLGTGFNGTVYGVAVEGNGNIVVGGYFTTANEVSRNHLARITPDGMLDPRPFNGPTGPVLAVVAQRDGTVLIAGHFQYIYWYDWPFSYWVTNCVARLGTDLSPDRTFSFGSCPHRNPMDPPGPQPPGTATALAVQEDGQILVASTSGLERVGPNGGTPTTFTTLSGTSIIAVQGNGKIVLGAGSSVSRFNTDGTLDAGFTTRQGTGFNGGVSALAVQGDGKVVVGGAFTTLNGIPSNGVARLDPPLFAAGLPDTTFAANLGAGFSDAVSTLAIQTDGKVVVGGPFTSVSGLATGRLARLNPDGSPDTAFATNLGTGFGYSRVSAVAVQRNGQIVVGGDFWDLNNIPSPRIGRVNADGTPDTAFSTNLGTGFNGEVSDVVVQEDGKIVVGGTFTTLNGNPNNNIARLRADGTPDTTFASHFDSYVWALAVQGDGKIVVGGRFASLNGFPASHITRLNADGTRDATFSSPLAGSSEYPNDVSSVAIQGDGRILVGGYFLTASGGSSRNRLARLNADGTLDMTFTPNISTVRDYDHVYVLAVQADGKILVGGNFTKVNGIASSGMARLNPDGTLDATFTSALGTSFDHAVSAAAVQGDGRIVVGGGFFRLNGATARSIARLNSSGARDTSFITDVGAGFNHAVYAAAVQGNGQIVVGGAFTMLNGVVSNRLARLNADGSRANGFDFDSSVHAVAVQGDGAILVGGAFTALQGAASHHLARLSTNGGRDLVFDTHFGTGFDGAPYAVVVQRDGKIVVGGAFTTLNGAASNRIARLNGDGSADTTFMTNLGTGFESTVRAVAVQVDGKIVAGGVFTTLNSVAANHIARLNADGAPDTTFSTHLGTGFDSAVYAVAVQGDGRIVVGGAFTTVNGIPSHGIARLDADGTPDPTFSNGLGSGVDGAVYVLVVQGDGTIVIGGAFSMLNGVAANHIARLNADGSPDATFATNVGTGFNDEVDALALQVNGRVVVGGAFTTLNGVPSPRLARLGAAVPGPPTNVTAVAGPGPSQMTVGFAAPNDTGGAAITNYTTTSNPGGVMVTGAASPLIVTGLSKGTYYRFTVTATNIVGTGDPSGPSEEARIPITPEVTAIRPASGGIGGGTVVTVTGAYFPNGSTTVTIGANAATNVSVVDTTSLTARTPAGVAGPATVTVTTPSGSASLVNGFTYFQSLFTDDPLQPGVTPLKAVHLTEVRQRIDALRARYSLPVMAWTDQIIVPGVTTVRAVHWAEVRTALQDAYVAAGRAPPDYSVPPPVPGGTLISVAHLAEIRAAIAALW